MKFLKLFTLLRCMAIINIICAKDLNRYLLQFLFINKMKHMSVQYRQFQLVFCHKRIALAIILGTLVHTAKQRNDKLNASC